MSIKIKVISVMVLVFLASACSSPPKLKEPKGNLFPINKIEVMK